MVSYTMHSGIGGIMIKVRVKATNPKTGHVFKYHDQYIAINQEAMDKHIQQIHAEHDNLHLEIVSTEQVEDVVFIGNIKEDG